MKNLFGVLCLLGAGIAVSCSSESTAFDASAAGGAATGGSSAVGGKTGAGGTTVNATEVPEKDWDSSGGAGGAADTTDTDADANGPFGDLYADPYYDANDPCSGVIPWITGVNTTIEDGNLVQYLGKIYEYDTTNGSCNKQLTNLFEQCIPSDPADWCKPCWISKDMTCP